MRRSPLCLLLVVAVWIFACGSSERGIAEFASGSGGQDAGDDVTNGGTGGIAGVGGSSGKGGVSGAAGTSGSAGASGDAGVAGSAGIAGTGGMGGTGGTQSTGGAGGTGGTTVCGSSTCGPLEQCFNGQFCAAKLVPITGSYGIDATEVTRAQYEAWLGTNPATIGQDIWCSWNKDFTPWCEWPPGTKGQHPVGCVDWCDAYAYCKAVGKRLCGKIGGGPNAYSEFTDHNKSQWFNVCSSGGARNYPYGGNPGTSNTDGYDGQVCNGGDNAVTGCGTGTCSPAPVGTLAGCQSSVSGYAGAYDLSGNVWEWEDSCDGATGNGDFCRARGGSFMEGDSYLRCTTGFPDLLTRSGSGILVGLRCCSDP